MSECQGQLQVAWTKTTTEKGFTTEEDARKAAHKKIMKKVVREVNHDGVCDGHDCDKGDDDNGDECLPSWDVLQQQPEIELPFLFCSCLDQDSATEKLILAGPLTGPDGDDAIGADLCCRKSLACREKFAHSL